MRLALHSFRRFLTQKDTWILLKADSTVAVGAVNSMESRSQPLMRELRALHRTCMAWGISLRAEHLPSAVNAYADRLSRENDSTDWALGWDAYTDLERRFGPHTVDLFASHLNAKCGRFYARHWCPGCEGTNALRIPWVGENFFANPPFNLMTAVVTKAIHDGATMTLVSPRWECQPWYWPAAEAADMTWHLPQHHCVFTHGSRTTPSPKPPWGVVVFRFSGGQRRRICAGNVWSTDMPADTSDGTPVRNAQGSC